MTLGFKAILIKSVINLKISKMDIKVSSKTISAAKDQARLKKAKAALTALEEKVYSRELEELIKKENIVSSFKVIQSNVREISDVAILTAIGKAVGIKRFVITTTGPRPYNKKTK